MSEETIKAQYLFLKERGELQIFSPNLVGKWEKDREEFTRQYNLNNDFLRSGLLDLDEYQDYP